MIKWLNPLAVSLIAVLSELTFAATPTAFSFGLIGDLPYTSYERHELPKLLAAMGEENLAFVIHDGDIKSGTSPCSDEIYQEIRAVFEASPLPLIYLPGDNEWTDCHRLPAGGYDPVERLAYLRQVFFAQPQSLGQRKLTLERQPAGQGYRAYPENQRWRYGPVLFVTLNVTGSDNGIGDPNHPSTEFLEREQANRVWLAEAFARARAEKLPALVIVIQANPDFTAEAKGQPKAGYRDFLRQLRDETRSFAGQVVLVHGDTHRQRIDQPMLNPASGQPLANFTRVETFGSPFIGWVKAHFTPDASPPLRFEAKPWPNEALPRELR